MSRLLKIEQFTSFKEVKDYLPNTINQKVLDSVFSLDEKEYLEPYILSSLFDPNDTPHGPAEIVDILTHKLSTYHEDGMAAFIIKGKSFKTIRPKDVSHQIYRLKKIAGLQFAIFAATGTILDASKEQFINTAKEIGCNYSIFDRMDLARLLVAKGFICPKDGSHISLGRCACGYSPENRVLNILQEDALDNLANIHKLSQNAGLVIMPTGSGKTRIAAEDAKRFGATRLLYVAHTHEILDVAKSEFSAVYGTENIKFLKKRHDFHNLSKANISTIQLISKNQSKLSSLNIDYLIVDEFHHAAASTYRKLLAEVNPKFLLGLTSTPFRGDKQDILELCNNNIVVDYELRAGIEKGILCPYHYFGCFDDIDYSNIKHNGIRYDIRDLERALVIPERDDSIIQKWKEVADGKATIAFCCSHRHAKRVCKSFNTKNIRSEIYLSETPLEERKRILDDTVAGKVKVICAVDVLNEGADFPFIECLLFLRPTESKRIFFQQLGRGLRKYVGKAYVTVIDFIGNFKNAYKIVEYQSLLSLPSDEESSSPRNSYYYKSILNLPIGCTVNFDHKVIDVFAMQTLDPSRANRHNIGKILIYAYVKLAERLGRVPTKIDVDRNLILHSGLYSLVFGSWKKFYCMMESESRAR